MQPTEPPELDPLSGKLSLFIQNLAQFDNVTAACRVSNLSRASAYHYRNKYQWFADAWDAARLEYLDNFEASGRMLALKSGDSAKILAYLRCIHPAYRPVNEAPPQNVASEQGADDKNLERLSVAELEQLEGLLAKASGGGGGDAETD